MIGRRGAPIGPVASWSVLILSTSGGVAAWWFSAHVFLLPTPLPALLSALAFLLLLAAGVLVALATKGAAATLGVRRRKT